MSGRGFSARACRRAAAVLAFALALPAASARAQGAPGDTLVKGYIRSISDSTDAYFGLSAQPADTTGLDSIQVYYLDHPGESPRQKLGVSFAPAFQFNRVVAVMYGGSASVGSSRGIGRLTGLLQWANGPNNWFGTGAYTLARTHDDGERGWTFNVTGGRRLSALNRDFYSPAIATVLALFFGDDRQDYLRRDGVRTSLTWNTGPWRLFAAYRNELESPMVTTATWTLTGAKVDLIPNAQATFGRASEARASALVKLPKVPFTVAGGAGFAGGPLGGDFEYHRYRAATGGGIALGSHFALAPQAEYARLTGAVLPQDVLYVGGQYSLMTVEPQSLEGNGRALARVDLLMHDDLLEVLRLRHNAIFPIQLGTFAATGARWGYDPATGAARLTERDWPGAEQWISEAGVSLMYRPGLPDPETFFRVDYVIPVGSNHRDATWFVSYKRTLHLLSRTD